MFTTPQIKEPVSLQFVDGILTGILNCEILDLETARAAVARRIKHFGDQDYLVLIDMKNIKHFTKEARDYLASNEGCNKIKAGAILVDSIVTKVIANFFLQISKPLIPCKLFTDEKSAREWLSKNKNSDSPSMR